MKPETETAVMKAHFEKSKKEAVTCLRAMGAELPDGMDPCSWEGVMTMYEDVVSHGKPAQKAAAGMAAMKWLHYHEECATYAALEAAEKVVESEIGGDGAEPEKEPAKVAHEPAKAPAAPQAGK